MKSIKYISFRFRFLIGIVFFSIPINSRMSAQMDNDARDISRPAPSVYDEIELYCQTLSPENQLIYERSLAEYLNNETQEVPAIRNRKLEQRFREVTAMPEPGADNMFAKYYAWVALSGEAGRKKERWLEADALYKAFMLAFWSDPRQYPQAFEAAIKLEERLAGITEDEYAPRRIAYVRLSEAYYLFKDFNKAIELAKLAITDKPARSFADVSNLEGRKILAMSYGTIGEYDSAYHYIRSTWASPDIVLNRPVYNAYALAHRACDEMLMGNFRKALTLNTEVLEYMKQTEDYGHVAGMYACQCYCYFGLNDPYHVGMAADSILSYARRDWYNQNKRLKQAYSNLSRYNGYVGNIGAMQQYQDSLIAIYQREEALAASQYILEAQQAVSRDKLLTHQKKITTHRNITYSILAVLSVICGFVVIIYRMYRRQRTAYRILAGKAKQWAELPPPEITSSIQTEPDTFDDTGDAEIAALLSDYIKTHKPYTDKGLTIETLARQMGIHRKKLSGVINRTNNTRFNNYINDLRVWEVMQKMKDSQYDNLTLMQLMDMGGFSNHTTFYNSFKKITGLTPAQYRKFIKEEKDQSGHNHTD